MGELLEVATWLATWLVYASAAIMMLGAIVAAVLAGFAVRIVAEVLREISYERREEGGPDTSTDTSM
ncbi:MAG: hypothetical protein M3309_10510 [Actinomycetota bacterium]|nr:hypothetical protein [Actinomycetota bacterium]